MPAKKKNVVGKRLKKLVRSVKKRVMPMGIRRFSSRKGFTDRVVKPPVAYGSVTHKNSFARPVSVSREEYLGDLKSGPTAGAFAAWNVCALNPGLAYNAGNDFPALSTASVNQGFNSQLYQIARLYEKHKLERFEIEYVPLVGTQTAGQCGITYISDPTQPLPASGSEMQFFMNHSGTTLWPVWKKTIIPLDKKIMLGPDKRKQFLRVRAGDPPSVYISSGESKTSFDIGTYDYGRFVLWSTGCAASQTLAQIRIKCVWTLKDEKASGTATAAPPPPPPSSPTVYYSGECFTQFNSTTWNDGVTTFNVLPGTSIITCSPAGYNGITGGPDDTTQRYTLTMNIPNPTVGDRYMLMYKACCVNITSGLQVLGETDLKSGDNSFLNTFGDDAQGGFNTASLIEVDLVSDPAMQFTDCWPSGSTGTTPNLIGIPVDVDKNRASGPVSTFSVGTNKIRSLGSANAVLMRIASPPFGSSVNVDFKIKNMLNNLATFAVLNGSGAPITGPVGFIFSVLAIKLPPTFRSELKTCTTQKKKELEKPKLERKGSTSSVVDATLPRAVASALTAAGIPLKGGWEKVDQKDHKEEPKRSQSLPRSK